MKKMIATGVESVDLLINFFFDKIFCIQGYSDH